MRKRHWQIYGEFCAFRPFPRVPPSPLSNYNQIKDGVLIARHHWRV
jgi:ribonuclease I